MRKSSLPAINAEMTRLLSKRIEAAVINIEGAAKSLCPVGSGNLRGSITHAPSNGSTSDYSDGGVVGTDMEYGGFVELGTVDSAPQPYLVPALVGTRHTTAMFLRGGI